MHTQPHTHTKTSSIVKEKVKLNSLVHNTHTHTLQRLRHKKAFHDSRDTRKRLHFERLRYEKERHSSHRKYAVRLDGTHTHTHAHTEASSTHKFISHLKVTNATLSNFSKYFRFEKRWWSLDRAASASQGPLKCPSNIDSRFRN